MSAKVITIVNSITHRFWLIHGNRRVKTMRLRYITPETNTVLIWRRFKRSEKHCQNEDKPKDAHLWPMLGWELWFDKLKLECCYNHISRKQTVVIMPTLPPLVAPQIVIMTICGATSDDKAGIMIILGFQCSLFDINQCDLTHTNISIFRGVTGNLNCKCRKLMLTWYFWHENFAIIFLKY